MRSCSEMSFVPNRKLLQHNFDGYKLASKHLSFAGKKLSSGVHIVRLKEQFSYQHVRAFSLHNHLYDDPWNQHMVYWCGDDAVMAAEFYPLDGGLDIYPVFQLPAKSFFSSKHQAMNVSLFHLDTCWCLFSDGHGGLSLLDKSQREGWKRITDLYLSSAIKSSLLPFIILFAKLNVLENSFDLVTLDLQKGQDEKPSSVITIRWYCITFNASLMEVKNSSAVNHTIVLRHTFSSSCMPLYTALVNQSLFVVNEAPLVSAGAEGTGHNSGNAQAEPHYGVGYKRKHEAESLPDKRSVPATSVWSWVQTDSDVTVTVNLPHDVTKHDITCIIDAKHLVVGLTDGTTYIRDDLYGTIDPHASNWIIEQYRLEANLEKKDPLGSWPMLLANAAENVSNIPQEDTNEQSKPIVMEDMLEECDLTEEDAMLMIYNSDGQLQYKAGLGGRQVLFSTTNPGGAEPPMFCVRHDIDALLWQPVLTPVTEEFPCQHIGTFNALGYVQASKRDKKFISCSNNLSFAAICDCSRNVYVYLQPEEKATTALQYVHTMGRDNSDILGMQATTTGLLFVLTNEELTVIKAITAN